MPSGGTCAHVPTLTIVATPGPGRGNLRIAEPHPSGWAEGEYVLEAASDVAPSPDGLDPRAPGYTATVRWTADSPADGASWLTAIGAAVRQAGLDVLDRIERAESALVQRVDAVERRLDRAREDAASLRDEVGALAEDTLRILGRRIVTVTLLDEPGPANAAHRVYVALVTADGVPTAARLRVTLEGERVAGPVDALGPGAYRVAVRTAGGAPVAGAVDDSDAALPDLDLGMGTSGAHLAVARAEPAIEARLHVVVVVVEASARGSHGTHHGAGLSTFWE